MASDSTENTVCQGNSFTCSLTSYVLQTPGYSWLQMLKLCRVHTSCIRWGKNHHICFSPLICAREGSRLTDYPKHSDTLWRPHWLYVLLVKAPSETKLWTSLCSTPTQAKEWKKLGSLARFSFLVFRNLLPPCPHRALRSGKEAKVSEQLACTPRSETSFSQWATHSVVHSMHTRLNGAAGKPAPLSWPICWRNMLFRAASTSSLLLFAVKARYTEKLLSPSQSSLNLFPPTSSVQPVSAVSHALTSAGWNTSNRKLHTAGECHHHLSTTSSSDRFHPPHLQTPSFVPPSECFFTGFGFLPGWHAQLIWVIVITESWCSISQTPAYLGQTAVPKCLSLLYSPACSFATVGFLQFPHDDLLLFRVCFSKVVR